MRTTTKLWQSVIAAGMTVVMLSTAGVAHADEPGASAEGTVGVVEDTAGDLVMPEADSTVVTEDGTVSVEGGIKVAVPADGDAPITVTGASGDAPTVEIGLPDLGGSGESDVTDTGVSVFDGDDASVVVNPVEGGGVQAIVTLDNADAPTVLPFEVEVEPGSQMNINDTGGVDVFAADGTLVGEFMSPWAVDANGNNIPTHFEITADGQVVQIVDTNADTAFPVVADPWWNPFSWNWGKILKKAKGCVSGSLQFATGFGVGQAGIKTIANKLAGAGLRVVSTTPTGFWIMAGAGCIVGAVRNW